MTDPIPADAAMVASMLGIGVRHVRRLAALGLFQTIGQRRGGRGRPADLYDLHQVLEAWLVRHPLPPATESRAA